MANDYESLLNWIINNTGIDFEDRIIADYYKNDKRVDKDIEIVKKEVERTAKDRIVRFPDGKFRRQSRQETIDNIDKFFEEYMKPRLDDSVEEVNQAKVGELEKAENRMDLNIINVSDYRKATIQFKLQRARKLAFEEKVEIRKQILFDNPEEGVRYRRTWNSVVDYFELNESELKKLKDILGEDYLK